MNKLPSSGNKISFSAMIGGSFQLQILKHLVEILNEEDAAEEKQQKDLLTYWRENISSVRRTPNDLC